MNSPPKDWSDKAAWNDYFKSELLSGCRPAYAFYAELMVLRDLPVSFDTGVRLWIAGCGLDPFPNIYARQGCRVLATDFATVAVDYQQRVASAILKEAGMGKLQGSLTVAEHDFTESTPNGEFDVVINNRAFQGLSPQHMGAAAAHFYAALRPGGVCILLTVNVAESRCRNLIEDNLIGAHFVIPGSKSERWYREQIDQGRGGDSVRVEYEQLCTNEAQENIALITNPAYKTAHVIYGSG